MIADRVMVRSGRAPTQFRLGTHRRLAPEATLAAILPIAERCGVTRLVDVTNLDTIGIPVFQAIRPLARSLSVSQGKGVTRVAARVSALMASIELHHAETVAPSGHGPARAGDCLPPEDGSQIDWCCGVNLLSGLTTRVPHARVSMDFARNECEPIACSNGLASGNDAAEAIVSALCEVIERDAHARWLALSPAERHRGSIDPESIATPLGRRLLRVIRNAGLGMQLWSFGEDHGVAAIACALYDLSQNPVLGPVTGTGAHLDPGVALARAVTEAAQARATRLARASDDFTNPDYAAPAAMRLRFLIETVGHGPAAIDWASLRSRSSGCLARDADRLLAGAEAAGARQIVCVPLSDDELPIAVAKIIVPGFLGQAGARQTLQ